MRRLLICAIAVLVGISCYAEAQAAKIGREFKVNKSIYGGQIEPSVARLKDGGFIVVWASSHESFKSRIYGQRYNASGAPVGTEFLVSSDKPFSRSTPAVAGLSDGGFMVVWSSFEQDGFFYGVYGQRFGATGQLAGTEFRIPTFFKGAEGVPTVTGLAHGGFVVVWQSINANGSGRGIFGQRYGTNGAKAGGEFKVNTNTKQLKFHPSIAALTGGGFVVTWSSEAQDSPDSSGIYGQRYTAAGVRAGKEFLVNTETKGTQEHSSVAALGNGGFVVAWDSFSPFSGHVQDGGGSGIYAQRFSSAGAKLGKEFRVNTTTKDDQKSPSAAGLSGGGFMITWMSLAQDKSGWGIYAQRYAASAAPFGKETRVNTTTKEDQDFPRIAPLNSNGAIIVWQSLNQDGSYIGVYGQRYDGK